MNRGLVDAFSIVRKRPSPDPRVHENSILLLLTNRSYLHSPVSAAPMNGPSRGTRGSSKRPAVNGAETLKNDGSVPSETKENAVEDEEDDDVFGAQGDKPPPKKPRVTKAPAPHAFLSLSAPAPAPVDSRLDTEGQLIVIIYKAQPSSGGDRLSRSKNPIVTISGQHDVTFGQGIVENANNRKTLLVSAQTVIDVIHATLAADGARLTASLEKHETSENTLSQSQGVWSLDPTGPIAAQLVGTTTQKIIQAGDMIESTSTDFVQSVGKNQPKLPTFPVTVSVAMLPRNNSITIKENLVLLQKTDDFLRFPDTDDSFFSLQVLLPEVDLKRILQFSEKGPKNPPGLCLTQGAIDLKKAPDTFGDGQSFVTRAVNDDAFKPLGITDIPAPVTAGSGGLGTHAEATTHTSSKAQADFTFALKRSHELSQVMVQAALACPNTLEAIKKQFSAEGNPSSFSAVRSIKLLMKLMADAATKNAGLTPGSGEENACQKFIIIETATLQPDWMKKLPTLKTLATIAQSIPTLSTRLKGAMITGNAQPSKEGWRLSGMPSTPAPAGRHQSSASGSDFGFGFGFGGAGSSGSSGSSSSSSSGSRGTGNNMSEAFDDNNSVDLSDESVEMQVSAYRQAQTIALKGEILKMLPVVESSDAEPGAVMKVSMHNKGEVVLIIDPSETCLKLKGRSINQQQMTVHLELKERTGAAASGSVLEPGAQLKVIKFSSQGTVIVVENTSRTDNTTTQSISPNNFLPPNISTPPLVDDAPDATPPLDVDGPGAEDNDRQNRITGLWRDFCRLSRDGQEAEIKQLRNDPGLLQGAGHLDDLEVARRADGLYNVAEPDRVSDDEAKVDHYREQVVRNFQAIALVGNYELPINYVRDPRWLNDGDMGRPDREGY